MTKQTLDQIRSNLIADKTVAEWDKNWEPLANAFTIGHPKLRHVVGLFRTKLNGETKYIVRATELNGGIAKGLKRICGPNQTGNSGYGAQMVRKHIDKVEVDILRVEGVSDRSLVAMLLKIEMNKLYDPIWGMAFKRRMKLIADGIIPPN